MNVHQKPWAGILLEVDPSVRPESYYYYYYYRKKRHKNVDFKEYKEYKEKYKEYKEY